MANNFNEYRDDLYCRYCNRQCKNLNSLKQHEIRCKFNPDKINYDITHLRNANKLGNYKCSFCDREFKHFNNLKSHEAYCKFNPNHIESWNKGLTKYTSDSIKKCADSLTGKSTGRASSPEKEAERKSKISATMKKNGKSGGLRKGSGRGKKGWYKGYFCDSTYELVYVIYNIDHNIWFERFKGYYTYTYKEEKHKYFPDFILSDNSLVEVKGYYTEQVKAKINSVKDRPIKLLLGCDLNYAFDYVKENYTYNKLEDLYENK